MRRVFFEDGYISLFMFLRYFWRVLAACIFFYVNSAMSLVIWKVRNLPSPAAGLQALYIAILIWLLLTLAFSLWVWRWKALYKPFHWRNGTSVTVRVVRVSDDGSVTDLSKTQRMWHAWWAFNWRYFVITLIPVLIYGSAYKVVNNQLLELDLVTILWCGWLAMWWWNFHPHGKTHVLLTRIEG